VKLTNGAEIVGSSSDDKTVRVWSIKKIQLLFTFRCHNFPVDKVMHSQYNSFIFAGSKNEVCVRLWSIRAGSNVSALRT
jgi:WD40 repeat protein